MIKNPVKKIMTGSGVTRERSKGKRELLECAGWYEGVKEGSGLIGGILPEEWKNIITGKYGGGGGLEMDEK